MNVTEQAGTVKQPKSAYFHLKHAIDFLLCLSALLILLPFLVAFSILIKLNSSGPIFYRQERIGLNGEPFTLIKFRTMWLDAEKDGPQLAQPNDERITTIGRFLRKYRIDEIPQFINILRGEMSLIGPRPEREVFIKDIEKKLPRFRERLKVKPGITGWAQIHGGYDLSPKEKLEFDLYYIRHFSFWMDAKIILKSIPVILFCKGWR
nr:sugar transferase [Neobacillus sp. Marseille-Q6967]